MFAQHFVAAHQQVGDFVAVKVNGVLQKNGGNVASYFCTPAGRVIHSVVGPVSASELMEEAQWALDAYAAVDSRSLLPQMQHMSWAHRMAVSNNSSANDQRIHQLLAIQPLAPLAVVYDKIFEDILGEEVSRAAPRLRLAERALTLAERTGRPLLFLLHEDQAHSMSRQAWWQLAGHSPYRGLLRQVLADYVVIVLPLEDMPALSQRLGQPPFEAPSNARPLFVIADSRGRQLGALAGWRSDAELLDALARGLVAVMQERPPARGKLVRTVRIMKKIDPGLAEPLRQLARQRYGG